jgi:nucleotide-binding universal stress UspA family protein
MIVSASYKTDIPAFYGDWFVRRLQAGSCRMVNPYGRQVYTVDLGPGAVDGFVFWTRNLGPFVPALAEVCRLGFPFVVQYTITGYPLAIEASVPEAGRGVAHLRALAQRHGRRAGVWRYDPILITSLTPPDWHRETFAGLARALAAATDEVVISFAHLYVKTRRNLDEAARRHGFTWRDPPDDEKRDLLAALRDIAAAEGIRPTICSQPQFELPGLAGSACIDAARLGDVAGRPIAVPEKGNRPGCRCAASRDIGDYDTCPHGCAYCYAVRSPALAKQRFRAHAATDEMLSPA